MPVDPGGRLARAALLRPAGGEGEKPRWSAATPASSSRPSRRTVGGTPIASTSRRAAGKAELGVGSDGHPRDPKKSAKLTAGQSAAGCAVLWGDPATAHHLMVAEGIETAAALALAHRAEIEAGRWRSRRPCRPAASGPSSRGQRPAGSRSRPTGTKAAQGRPWYRAGERAARAFALAHHERVEIRIALPGEQGEDVDWLDVLRREGRDAVRSAIAAAQPFPPATRTPAGTPRLLPRRAGRSAAVLTIWPRALRGPERSVRARGAASARRGSDE